MHSTNGKRLRSGFRMQTTLFSFGFDSNDILTLIDIFENYIVLLIGSIGINLSAFSAHKHTKKLMQIHTHEKREKESAAVRPHW